MVRKVTSERLQPLFQRIVTNGYRPQSPDNKYRFRKELGRYVRQYSFISQIMTFTDTALEKFYLFTKLLRQQLPYERQTLPLDVVKTIDIWTNTACKRNKTAALSSRMTLPYNLRAMMDTFALGVVRP